MESGFEKIFYVLGAIFAISAILYFSWEYILSFTKITKTIIIFALFVFFFFVAEELRKKGI